MNNDLPWFTVRPIRWCWRILWSRRAAWALVCLVSLTVLYYQWENWRSAKELAVEHQRLVARFGTDNPVDLADGPVPDEQNYFANPVIQSWAKPARPGSLGVHYGFPKTTSFSGLPIASRPLMRYPDDDSYSELDLAEWAANRSEAGKPIPVGLTPLQALSQELGDAHGLLAKLSIGLDLPYSRMIPSARELAQAEIRDPASFQFNAFLEWDFIDYLGLHLRTAAQNGDPEKVRTVSMIMLRIAEAISSPRAMGAYFSAVSHGVAFGAIHETLAYPVWSDASLVALARQLSKIDDLELKNRSIAEETLSFERMLIYFREKNGAGLAQALVNLTSVDQDSRPDLAASLWITLAPRGWIDASNAYFIRSNLNILGPPTQTDWIDRIHRAGVVTRDSKHRTGPIFAMISNISSIEESLGIDSVMSLFKRRCLIIACALERYRLQHGAFPDSLEAVKTELAAFKVNDPARPDQPMGYRMEPTGYVLWSAGEDAKDNGGVMGEDWLWRLCRP